MKLIKVKNGLLEAENFFLASPFSDFAGSNNITRDTGTGKLSLISDNKIERYFPYNEFVIEMEKEKFNSMNPGDYSTIYLGNKDYTFGIRDKLFGEQKRYWKILKQDNYIQAYVSDDGISYTNIGGMEFSEDILKQGFAKYNNGPFILNSYNVYDNPYITLQNFPENTTCELYDSHDKLLKIRLFDNNLECKIYLDNNNIEGYLIFKDVNNVIIYTTDNITLGYGDIWVVSPYNFEIIYLGNVVTNINPSLLQDLNEAIVIKNIGSTDYTGIVIGTQTNSNDLIQLSLDGVVYTNTLTLNILQNEEKTLLIKIVKNADNHNFQVRDFQLMINE
ncbi:hypothetical protein psyc5s11_29910 [Clostridium gelidum]|uniref:Uncharacterized protein n=1 Tax=Clostridium gelidum TaxID=704125 RepID=A0ABN6IXS0_9CLOT|nr:hypothetical protein [Clostridium gelidum]BCZ46924.1 hypothetical protein psyc5s11_29910 [Clostridium gelidum]